MSAACSATPPRSGLTRCCSTGRPATPLYRKAIRVSVGAALLVPFARTPQPDALLAAHGFDLLALTPSGREAIADIRPRGRTALLLGTEGAGLPAQMIARVRGVRIPMAPGFDSLNVATAGAIALHHLAARRTDRS